MAMHHKLSSYTAMPLIGLFAMGLSLGPATAANDPPVTPGAQVTKAPANDAMASPAPATTTATQKTHAQKLVNEASTVVKKMEKDPKLVKLMKKAKGLYIVPSFGRGAFVVGGRGGAGLMLVNQNGTWSDPAFYDFGGISLGPQVGGSGGAVVFLLMNDHAVNVFKNTSEFSLNAGAGFTIVTYSNNAQASWGKGDIILWSDTAGAYVGATVSVSDIVWDKGNNKAFYGKSVNLNEILAGNVISIGADKLKNVLPG